MSSGHESSGGMVYVCIRCHDVKKSAQAAKECCGWGYKAVSRAQAAKEHGHNF